MKTDFIEVIDNFLTPSYHQSLLSSVLDGNFPWYLNNSATDPNNNNTHYINGSEVYADFGFYHSLFKNNETYSDFSKLVFPIAFKIKDYLNATEVMRMRLDMTLYNPENKMHSPHVDWEEDHYSAIYYLNNSSGSTLIFDKKYNDKNCNNLKVKKSIEPKENRLLLFDGRYLHTGHSPSNNNYRILINFNLKP